MKTHLARLQIVAAITVAVGLCQHEASAQYLPYQPAPQATAPYGGYPAGVPQGRIAQQPYPNYQTQPQQQPQGQYPYQQPAVQNQYQPAVQNNYQPVAQNPYAGQSFQGYPAQSYSAQSYPGYPAVAQAGPGPEQVMPNQTLVAPNGQGEVLPGPANEMTVPGGNMNGMTMQGDVYHQGHVHSQMNGYPQTDAANCAPYPSTQYGSYGGGYNDYGLSGYFNQPACESSNQWFGGVYFLFMERDNASYQRITVQADPPTDPYYPPARTTIISTDSIDHNYREGVELRFGSTFTVGGATSCDPYGQGCGSCESQLYAWEFAIWGIDNDIEWFTAIDVIPTDTYRMYGMVNHAGLEYDNGGGYRPVNDYYDYQMPIEDDSPPVDGDVRVLAQRVRTNFRANNVELNFFRIPVCDVGCAPSSCDVGNGYGGNCAPGYGGYGGYGCEPAACAPSGPSFSMAALCGLRYFRMHDALEIATEYATYGGGVLDNVYDGFENSDNEIFHDVNVDNHLAGFQLGVNMNYCVACKWNVFADSNFGLYNNHINSYQRVYSPIGDIREVETGRDATYRSSKDDLAFLGELRLGGSYDISCNWRAVLAYRAVAISGVALSTEQIKPEMSNWAEVAKIDAGSSIIIHGVQAGVECRY